VIFVAPDGASYDAIVAKLSVPLSSDE
jgi:hypothetical protein